MWTETADYILAVISVVTELLPSTTGVKNEANGCHGIRTIWGFFKKKKKKRNHSGIMIH